MTARLNYWYLTHPRLGRPLLGLAVIHLLSIVATCTAPQATAATNTMLLNFTGLTDSYGVPIGSYYLSLASLTEQITEASPDITINPDSWWQWGMDSLATMLMSWGSADILTGLASFYIGVIALALWIFRITVSAYWLTVIGEIARAISTAVITAATQLGVLLICVPLGVFLGAMTIRRGESGRGWMMILVAIGLPALSLAVFADPAGAMYGPNGVLQFARSAGFSVASAATHNGNLGGTGIDGVTSTLITQVVREPLQLWNFGQVVDRVGGCGPAWSQAMMSPRLDPTGTIMTTTDAGVRAMEACGNQAAVSYAQHLDGANVWIGVIYAVCGLIFGFFMVASGWAVLKVSVKAIWTTVILLPTLWAGSVPYAPQERAVTVTWQFFKHGLEVLAYIVFVSVIGLTIQRIVSAPLPAELGGTNPVAHVLMMPACALAGWYLLKRVKAEFEDRPRRSGMMGRATGTATGMAMHGALGGAGKGAKTLAGKMFGSGGGTTPWDRQDENAQSGNDASSVHGTPKPGFDPIAKSSGGGGRGRPPASPPVTPGGGPGGGGGPGAGGVVPTPGGAGGAHRAGAQAQAQSAATTALAAKTGGASVAAGRAAQAAQAAVAANKQRRNTSQGGQGGQSPSSRPLPGAQPRTSAAGTGSDQPRQVPPMSTDQRQPGADNTRGGQPTADRAQPPPPTPPPNKVKPITRDQGGDRPR